jgi:hypothetical protein
MLPSMAVRLPLLDTGSLHARLDDLIASHSSTEAW